MSLRRFHAPVACLLVALLTTLVAGCGPEEPPARAPARAVEIRVGAEQDGGSTALKVGSVLRIELPANPLTGRAWEVEAVDESVLRMPVEEYVPPPPERPEAPGTSIWRFRAVGTGFTTVKLRCVTFGEDLPSREDTFAFDVLVD